ncbi:MAG: outer membrane beta-barrel family protein [Bacteroidota bacterium]
MYKRLAIINALLLLLFFNTLSAQREYSINAKVVDEQGHPIELGNVLLLHPEDSSLLMGDIFVDGEVRIDNIPNDEFLLNMTALGFTAFYQKVKNTNQEAVLNLGQIQLTMQLMKGVEVVGRQAVFEQKGTDLIVNVANTSLKEAGTAMDVLQNAPKVFINRSGQISIIGKGAALIYLNGQQVSSTQILSSLNSNDIKEIEIIENPSAKYDAAGNAVINIITKSKTLEGYKIGLLQRVAKAKYFRSYFQANTYYKINKLMLQASYGIRPWQWGGRNQQTRTNLADPTYSEIDNYFVQRNKRLDHDYNLRSTYQFSSNLKLNLQYTGTVVSGDKKADNIRTALSDEVANFSIAAKVTGPYDQKSNTLNVSLQNSLDTLGSNFQIVGQYATFDFERNERNEQIFAIENAATPINRKSQNLNDIRIYTFQTDYKKVVTPKFQVETGLKNAYVTNNSGINFQEEDLDGQYFILPQFTNGFDYSENILAGYGQFTWKGKTVNFSAGLRGEWTKTEGNSVNTGSTATYERSYFNVFPTASLQKTFEKGLTASIDYSYRINRPSFQALNPYVLFVDSLIDLRGNPNLVPEYSQNLSTNLNFKRWNLALNYVFTKGKINQVFRSLNPQNPEAISFVMENLQHTKLYSVALSRPLSYKTWNGYFTVGTFYDDHQAMDTEGLIKNDKLGYYVQVNQSLQLPWALKLDAYMNYTSSRVDGVYTDNPISYLNLSLSRKFFDNQLTVTLWGNDVFDKYKWKGVTNFNQMYATYLSEGDFHYIRLALNWNFGKLGTNQFGGKQVSKAELNRINPNM